MRTRLVSSVLVVIVGLIPTLVGGPLFALFMLTLGIVAYREFSRLTARAAGLGVLAGSGSAIIVIAAMAVAGLAPESAIALMVIVFFAIAAPLIALWPQVVAPGSIASWGLSSTGSLYLGLPVYAAVALRSLPGTHASPWLADLSTLLALGWRPSPVGLGWALTAVLATWVGDSAAYLVGRSLGNARLAPHLSPGKTVAGAVGGLTGSAAVGIAAFILFNLAPWWLGVIVGALIGVAGQIGDLCESFLKRQASVKDSGAFLPGHGGLLDRIDALLFAFPATLLLATAIDRIGVR